MLSRTLCRETPRLLQSRSPPLLRFTSRFFSSTPASQADFTHAVIGGGVVGLAIARSLVEHPSQPSVLLLERHAAVGTETSSRSSEVIHAGLYYGAGTLKTALCVRGRRLLYAYCASRGVPHRNTGKWIVAQTADQRAALESLYDFCRRELDVPLRWVGAEEAAAREPAVRAIAGVLESPETGIVDSHGLMLALLGDFEDGGGTLALESALEHVTPLDAGRAGWELTVRDAGSGTTSTVMVETIVNAAGLGAADVHNMIVPADSGRQTQLFYAKGNYFSYGASAPRVTTLIYPAPKPGGGGLGTHLTLDMGGRIRFGPDVEWVDSPAELAVNGRRLEESIREVKEYLPGIDETKLAPDYAGIRPKLTRKGAVMHGKGFVDFVIRKEEGYEGWVNLLGIESPGLTSCIAIGERVKDLYYT